MSTAGEENESPRLGDSMILIFKRPPLGQLWDGCGDKVQVPALRISADTRVLWKNVL